MAKKNQIIPRDVNGVVVEQRSTDGFINGSAMCVAHGKLIADWFRNQETIELVNFLAEDLKLQINYGISHNSSLTSISAAYPQLIISKRGSPETGGGTWLHPDLAVQLAQWCNTPFAIQVSRWVREWMTTGRNPIATQADLDRVSYRLGLKDEARLRMTDEVKKYLEDIKRYDDKKYAGQFFARVHDAINLAITGETARQMRERLGQIIGREIKQNELIRDYFPAMELQRYIAVCEASANLMIQENLHPLDAVDRACQLFLPAGYTAKQIDFVEHIKLVYGRVELQQLGYKQNNLLKDDNSDI